MAEFSHRPVLLDECIEGLAIRPDGVYVDGTAGGAELCIRDRQMKAQNLTLDQAITLASVIQKEAGRTDDMKMVSSIFHKRLENPAQFPKLQSDVTIFYVENDIKPYLENPDDPVNQPMYDAYNTYVCDGLPVGPISNPGVDAIKAAIYPQNTDYYYFLADKDGKMCIRDSIKSG